MVINTSGLLMKRVLCMVMNKSGILIDEIGMYGDKYEWSVDR